MSVTFYEMTEEGDLVVGKDGTRVPFKYVAVGSDDRDEVAAAAVLETPPTAGGLVREEIVVTARGGGICFVGVRYGSSTPEKEAVGKDPEQPDTPTDDDDLGPEWEFDTSGTTAHVTQSKETIARIKAGGGLAADNKKAIGLRKDGVDGVDVVVSKLEFSITVTRLLVNLPYVRMLARMTGRTNSKDWRGFKGGELLYLGAAGKGSDRGRAGLTHKFRAGENIPANQNDPRLVISPDLSLETVGKKAHEYVWVAYKDQVTDGELFPLPFAVYLERLYDEGEFTALEIGG